MNLVIGASTWAPDQIQPFLRSLSRFPGCGLELVDPGHGRLSPNCSRWALILDKVLGLSNADTILATDVRDVVFQADPFAWDVPDLAVFCESPRMTIGSCPYNSAWVRGYYGSGWLDRIGHERIICSGTVFGRREPMIEWLRWMVAEMDRLPGGAMVGADQGAHNVWVRDNPGRATIYDLFAGPVATVGYCLPEDLHVVNGTLRNADGSIPPVVHQHDRSPALCRELAALRS